MKHVESVVNHLLHTGAHSATKYVSPKEMVRATRKLVHGRIRPRDNAQIVLTIGRPNYRERRFIKDCIAAGVTFPVRKVQLKALPVRRK